MKKIYLILLGVIFTFWCCDDKEDYKRQVVDVDRYNQLTKDDVNSPSQHFIHEFFKNTGVVIIKNPTIEDYIYNFNMANKIKFIPPVQTEEVIYNGITFLKEIAINHYLYDKDDNPNNDYDFIKKYFPFTLQLADTIVFEKNAKNKIYYNAYSSRNLLAISGINESLATISKQKKNEIQAEFNSRLWQSFLIDAIDKYRPNPKFFTISKDFSGKMLVDILMENMDWIDWDSTYGNVKDENLDDYRNVFYERGYLKVTYEWESYFNFLFPDYNTEIEDFMYGVFLLDHSELMRIADKYPRVKEKYEILRNDLLEQFNFDINTVNNN